VQKVWEPIETKAFAEPARVEEEALRLYKEDPARAKAYLTKYSHDIANGAVEAYWKLSEDLWTKYTNYFTPSPAGN
jgi:dipeptidase